MLLRKLVDRYRNKLAHGSPRQLLRDLGRELRSDDVPAVFRDAARSVASLLDGAGEGETKDGSAGGVTINVTIAVAVGAPGKEQDSKAPQPSPGGPNDAVVIASAVAMIPGGSSSRRGPSDATRAGPPQSEGPDPSS